MTNYVEQPRCRVEVTLRASVGDAENRLRILARTLSRKGTLRPKDYESLSRAKDEVDYAKQVYTQHTDSCSDCGG